MKRRHRRPLALAMAVVLITAGCGDRLTPVQRAALDASSSGGVTPTTAGGPLGPAQTGPVVTTPGAVGATPGGPASPGLTTAPGGLSPSRSTTSPSPSRSAGTGPSGPSGPATVTQAGNPLAGPGGKVCAAGAPGSGPGVTPSTITVGNIATVNGPVPGLFAGARFGAQAVADYINSSGGICGRKLVVDSADDQFDQATDQQEAASMAGNVLAFLGSFSLQDPGIPAGAPGVPDLGEPLSAARFNSADNYAPQPNPPGFDTGQFTYIKSQPQWAAATQHMAMLIENTPQTATTGAWEQQALESAGYKFVFTDASLQPTDPTFNGDVQKMKNAGVQGVVFQATATIMGQLANAMYQAGMTLVIGNWCAAAYDPAFIQNAGPGTAGTVLTQSTVLYEGEDAATVPMVSTFDQWYARVNPGQTPDIFALYAWTSGLMLASALNEAGSVSRASLVSGLKTLTTFSGDGLLAPGDPVTKTPPACYLLIDVKGGRFVRDPANPTGFRCSPAGYYHYS